MKKTIWYMYKPGEERDFVSTKQPNEEWAKIQKSNGYIIVSFEIDIPDPSSINLGTQALISPTHKVGPSTPPVFTVEKLSNTLRELFSRASGDMICEECGKDYYSHPQDSDQHWLNVLCSGRRVKL